MKAIFLPECSPKALVFVGLLVVAGRQYRNAVMRLIPTDLVVAKQR